MGALRTVTRGIAKNATTILTIVGCAGVVTTTALAIKATPHAQAAMQKVKDDISDRKPTRRELLKAALPYYIPTIVSAGVTTGCIIGSHHLSCKENAALASLASMSEVALNEYQNKVVEKLGEKKAREIEGEILEDHIKANPVSKSEVIVTGRGQSLMYDDFSGRYFMGNYDDLATAVRKIGTEINRNLWASYNDLYYLIGLSGVEYGEEIGWDIDHIPEMGRPASKIADDGRPALIFRVTKPLARSRSGF
jgi:hypothetical protein